MSVHFVPLKIGQILSHLNYLWKIKAQFNLSIKLKYYHSSKLSLLKAQIPAYFANRTPVLCIYRLAHSIISSTDDNQVFLIVIKKTLVYRMLFLVICSYIFHASRSSQQSLERYDEKLYIPYRNLILSISIINPTSENCPCQADP